MCVFVFLCPVALYNCQLLYLPACVIMCVRRLHAPLSIYWYFYTHFFFLTFERKPVHICVCATIYVHLSVCLSLSLSSYIKANSRLPSYFQNSRHALILVLSVSTLLQWSVVALGEHVESEVSTKLCGDTTVYCWFCKEAYCEEMGRQKTEGESDSHSSGQRSFAAKLLPNNPDHKSNKHMYLIGF